MRYSNEIAEIYDQEAARYDELYQDDIHLIENAIVSYFIGRLYIPGKSVLDIGCGTGHAISLGNIRFKDYLGIDISQGMVDVARAKYPRYLFYRHDATKPLSLKRYGFLAIYGQINYFGFEPFLQILENSAHDQARFLIILYARKDRDCRYESGDPPKKFFPVSNIYSIFDNVDFEISLYDFSYPDDGANMTFKAQLALTMSSLANGECKYIIIEGRRNA